jgi:hypothetical protein
MKRKTRSILEELNSMHGARSSDLMIESSAENIMTSCINFISRLHEKYDVATAADLEKRFINAIKSGDQNKFKRKIKQIIESKK